MSQWTYRAASVTTAGGAVGDALAINKPVGAAAGDLMVIGVYWETDANTITPPSGVTSALRQVNTGAFMIEVFYRLLDGSEGASFTFTPATNGQFRGAVATCYQNGTGSGPWVDVSGGAQADGALEPAQNAPTVTTTGTNRLIIALGGFFSSDATASNGAAPNYRGHLGGAGMADGSLASAGATGTTNFTGGGTQDFAGITVAFVSDSGGSLPPGFQLTGPSRLGGPPATTPRLGTPRPILSAIELTQRIGQSWWERPKPTPPPARLDPIRLGTPRAILSAIELTQRIGKVWIWPPAPRLPRQILDPFILGTPRPIRSAVELATQPPQPPRWPVAPALARAAFWAPPSLLTTTLGTVAPPAPVVLSVLPGPGLRVPVTPWLAPNVLTGPLVSLDAPFVGPTWPASARPAPALPWLAPNVLTAALAPVQAGRWWALPASRPASGPPWLAPNLLSAGLAPVVGASWLTSPAPRLVTSTPAVWGNLLGNTLAPVAGTPVSPAALPTAPGGRGPSPGWLGPNLLGTLLAPVVAGTPFVGRVLDRPADRLARALPWLAPNVLVTYPVTPIVVPAYITVTVVSTWPRVLVAAAWPTVTVVGQWPRVVNVAGAWPSSTAAGLWPRVRVEGVS